VSRSVRPCSAQDVTGSERVCAGQRNGSEPERNERRGPFHVSSEGDCCAARIYPHTRGPRHEGLKGGASQACAGGVGCLSACSAVRERTASRHALALPRWAASRAIGTEDTAIADLGRQRLVTPGALVEVNASIGRHRFDPPMTAEWTRDCGFWDHSGGPPAPSATGSRSSGSRAASRASRLHEWQPPSTGRSPRGPTP